LEWAPTGVDGFESTSSSYLLCLFVVFPRVIQIAIQKKTIFGFKAKGDFHLAARGTLSNDFGALN
jgi:hypothetical protein